MKVVPNTKFLYPINTRVWVTHKFATDKYITIFGLRGQRIRTWVPCVGRACQTANKNHSAWTCPTGLMRADFKGSTHVCVAIDNNQFISDRELMKHIRNRTVRNALIEAVRKLASIEYYNLDAPHITIRKIPAIWRSYQSPPDS